MVISDLSRSTLQLLRSPRVPRQEADARVAFPGKRPTKLSSSPLKVGARLTMAATTTKPDYTVRWKDEENERNLRKLFFAAVRSHARPWGADRASGGDVYRRHRRSLPPIERVMKFTTQRIGL